MEGGGRRGICGQRGRILGKGAGSRWGKATTGEGASDRGGEERPKRGSGSRLERRRQPTGKDDGDADGRGAWRRGGVKESSACQRGGATESWRREGAMEKDDDLSAISSRGQFCNFTSFHLVGKDLAATIISERRE